jgi:hypothetical protein
VNELWICDHDVQAVLDSICFVLSKSVILELGKKHGFLKYHIAKSYKYYKHENLELVKIMMKNTRLFGHFNETELKELYQEYMFDYFIKENQVILVPKTEVN